jgi:hypothetical protein
MRRLLSRGLVLGIVGAMFAGGTAYARNFTDITSLSINVQPRHISAGEIVSISGHLSADHVFCRKNSKIILKKVVSGPDPVIGTTTTNYHGFYQFTKHPKHTTTYYTRFNGKEAGTHPNHHVCLGSRSPNQTVFVT